MRARSTSGRLQGKNPLPFFKPFANTLYGILNDIDKHLLEKNSIQMNGYSFVSEIEVNFDICLRTQIFEERTAGIHLFTEVA